MNDAYVQIEEFYHGKRVLVTGHTGFVGCWLTMTLVELGADVTGFSLPAEVGSLFSKVKESLNIHSIEGDLRNSGEIQNAVKSCAPEIVFHLAAFGFVNECFADPARAFSTNVDGTMNLLEAIRDCDSVKTLVAASSDKVYLNRDVENARFTEDAPLGGMDPYSASKTCEDLLIQSYCDSYLKSQGLSCAILRPSNILGGGDHLISRLIPGMFYSLRHGKTPEIRNPRAVRPWQNILDAVDAYLCAALIGAPSIRIYNVGPKEDDLWTVGEIAAFVSGLYGQTYDTSAISRDGVREHTYLGINTEKIRRELGWEPIRSLRDTLEDIYSFYSADDGYNTASLCKERIHNYFIERGNTDGALG